MPVPHREDRLVLRERRRRALPLLRLPGVGRRHHLRPRAGASRLRRGRRAAGVPGRHDPHLRPARREQVPRRAQAAHRHRGPGRGLLPRAPARRARCRRRPAVPARPGLRRRRGAGVAAGLGARRLGSAGPGPAAVEAGPGRQRPRLRQPSGPGPGLLPGPGAVPHPRPRRDAGRVRGPDHARRRGPQVHEHVADQALRQVARALRARPRQGGHRPGRRGRGVRGVHRRDRLLPGGRAPSGRHLRHRAHRRPRPPAPSLRPPDRPRLRRRRRRPGGCRPLLPVGGHLRPRRRRRLVARGGRSR